MKLLTAKKRNWCWGIDPDMSDLCILVTRTGQGLRIDAIESSAPDPIRS